MRRQPGMPFRAQRSNAQLLHQHNVCVVCWLQCCSYLSWDRKLAMLHDVAAGMSYLHGRSHIHGDLRSPNLFVGADGMVRKGTGSR